MKSKIVGIGLGLMALSATASPAWSQIRFVGAGTITSVTSACASQGWAVGNIFGVSYRPPNLDTNGPTTYLNFFFSMGATSHRLSSGNLVGTTFQTIASTFIFSVFRQRTEKMRFTSQTPATLTNATPSITFVGGIQNWDVDNCNITFKASGVRIP